MPIERSPRGGRPGDGERGSERALWPAVTLGWRGRCPECGEGRLFARYLEVAAHCPHCTAEMHHHRADDLPAWATMVIVGHVLALLLLAVENAAAPALWVHALIWPPVVIGLSLWLLPRIKGAVVAMQWAWRMHGFGQGA